MWQEQLGVIWLGAYLRQHGHDARVIIQRGERDLIGAVVAARPTLIAFSTTTGDHLWVAREARRLKEALPDTPIVAGGPHPTFFPRFLEAPGIDYICRGEGEEALLQLVEAVEGGEDGLGISNIWAWRDGKAVRADVRPLIDPLDQLPFPDRSLYQRYRFFQRDRVFHVMFSRGCPFSCSYCFNAAYRRIYAGKGRYVRLRSVEHSLEELGRIESEYDVRLFYFVDDIFGLNRSWTREFLRRYAAEITAPFICNSHVKYITEEFAEGLAAAGCFSVQFAIESGNDQVRQGLLSRPETKEEIIAAARRLHRHGIRFLTFNMLGCPGETVDQAFETIQLNTEIRTDFPRFSLLQPYPQTAIYEYALRHGYVSERDIDSVSASYFSDTVVNQPNIKELINLQRLFWPAIRLPGLRRLIRWLIKLPPNWLFDAVYLLSLGVQYARCTKRGILRTIFYGLRNLSFWRS